MLHRLPGSARASLRRAMVLRGSPIAACLLAGSLALTGCTPAASQPREGTSPGRYGAHNDTSTPFNLVSIPALTAHEYDGRGLRLDRVIARELAYTRYHVSYRSGDLRITGIMNVPNRDGRFPLLVLAHGYIAPENYQNGAGLVREQTYLANHGYVVFHPDYRNHAGSDREGGDTVRRPLGYPEDLVNAVVAAKEADLPFVDPDRIGVFGRSMGGGVALNAVVARPELFDAALLYSPVSSRTSDNFERWVAFEPPTATLRRRVVTTYGAPDVAPETWSRTSARNYLDRVEIPVQIHHGTADAVCPWEWSEATATALEDTDADVELFAYPGEQHRFDEAWPLLMRRTVDFFDAELG